MDSFKGRAKRLDDIDLPKLGALIGVGEDELHAFIDVETTGTGFDSEGRPKILFERHKFYNYVPLAFRAKAIDQGLAHKTPGGYGKESEQYGKLFKAIAIDRKAALYSCSWGLGQIMGFNHKLAGYDTVEAMVKAFMDDEENHLRAAVTFIQNTGLATALRNHNWAAFAKGYNGANYKINNYDKKLADAFAKWSRIKDTPWPPLVDGMSPEIAVPVKPAVPGSTPTETPVVAEPAIIVTYPVPAAPTGPRGKTSWAVVASFVAAIAAGLVRYFGG